jgi:hypothetical protein
VYRIPKERYSFLYFLLGYEPCPEIEITREERMERG